MNQACCLYGFRLRVCYKRLASSSLRYDLTELFRQRFPDVYFVLAEIKSFCQMVWKFSSGDPSL
jgi:hypothetical protein